MNCAVFDIMSLVSRRLENPETRICGDCSQPFVTSWSQRLCDPCRYIRASRSRCTKCGGKTGRSGYTLCGLCRYGTPPAIRAMSPVEVAWLAAIVEGEGTFGRTGRPGGQVRVVMTDLDIIKRLQTVTGLGLVHSRGRRADHHKETWEWAVTRRQNVCVLVERLAPLLLQRRRAGLEFILRAGGRPMPSFAELRPGQPEAWAWVAGMIEGEGCIVPGPASKDQRPRIVLEMTDFDVIERLFRVTTLGTVYAIHSRREREQPLRRWDVSRGDHVRTILQNVLPHLGERRRERAVYALSRL